MVNFDIFFSLIASESNGAFDAARRDVNKKRQQHGARRNSFYALAFFGRGLVASWPLVGCQRLAESLFSLERSLSSAVSQ